MTVMLELKPDLEAAARTFADAEGLAVEDYLYGMLEDNLKARRNAEIRQRNIARNQAAIALLQSWSAEADPEAIQDQRETLAYLKTAIDEDRPGQRSVFGKGYNP